jgi:hypothetical protein
VERRQFGFRDSANYYYPLYQRVQQHWQTGKIPLWEPGENAGVPLLGNPTAAVLYPGKLVFAVIEYDSALRVYTVAHVLGAAAAMFALLRYWKVGTVGCCLGALTYAFAAPVLFQTCNVIYLVGAAWAPLGLLGADRWLRRGRPRGLIEFAVALAMQALGGDLQAAYVTGLCAAAYSLVPNESSATRRPLRVVGPISILLLTVGTLFVAWRVAASLRFPASAGRIEIGGRSAGWLDPGRWSRLPYVLWVGCPALVVGAWVRSGRISPWGMRVLPLLGAGCLAFALAGAQLVPAIEFARQSTRAVEGGGLLTFWYSLWPAFLADLAWPNFFGTASPANRSWLPAAGPWRAQMLWVPSIYGGCIALVSLLAYIGRRRMRPPETWLLGIAVVSLAFAMGEFASPLFLARSIPALHPVLGPHDPLTPDQVRHDGYLDDAVGSPYWALTKLLPSFGVFRFPAKFLTFATLAVAALTGFGWDRVIAGQPRQPLFLALFFFAVSAVLLIAVEFSQSAMVVAWSSAPFAKRGSMLGPFDARGAHSCLERALIHGALVFGLLALILRGAAERPVRAGLAILLVTALDLATANSKLVWTVPETAFHGEPEALKHIREAEAAQPSEGPYRVFHMAPWAPPRWTDMASGARLQEFVTWQRGTLQPKFGVPEGVSHAWTEGGAAELADYRHFYDPLRITPTASLARTYGFGPGEDFLYYPRRSVDLWGGRYLILPTKITNSLNRCVLPLLPETERLWPDSRFFQGPGGAERQRIWTRDVDCQVLRNRAAFARAWAVHQARVVSTAAEDWRDEILYQADDYWLIPGRPTYDPRKIAWVDQADWPRVRSFLAVGAAGAIGDAKLNDRVAVTRHEPCRVELEAELELPGLVILADAEYPGWTLTVDGNPTTIHRVNHGMRGALVQAGRHHLIYRYEPRSLRHGLVLSGAGALILIAAFLSGARQLWRR